MFSFLKGRKGITVIEIVVALAVIGIISVPMTMAFVNSMRTNKMSREQIEINAITRIVKENVVQAIKSKNPVHGNGDVLRTDSALNSPSSNLTVRDHEGNVYPLFQFDVELKENTTNGLIDCLITLKKTDGAAMKPIRKFRIEVNTLT